MIDYTKPIPEIEFVPNRKPVANPSLEPLVYLDDMFICDSAYHHWVEDNGNPIPGSSPSIMARESVAKMLVEAEALLPEGHRFKIFDAYRPVAVQQALYNYFRAIKEKENPGEPPEEIDRLTQFCVSFPSYNVLLPSIHNTGGAVDLTIVGPDGKELDMGCDFDEFTDRPWTNYYELEGKGAGLNDVARDNRRMLYNIMLSVGFTNFPSEWWHFDYGDEKWAQFTNNTPIYAGFLDAKQRDSVPYSNMELVRETDTRQQEIVREIAKLRAETDVLDEKAATVARGY